MEQSLRETFMQLLRIGLWGEGQLRLTQPLSDADWQQIYQKARDQAVVGIIYASWEHLDASILPPRALRMRWTVHVEQIERFNRQMNKVLAEQYVFFTQAGLQPILQKGQGVAACYRQPLLRQSGDIDWYFQNKGYNKAIQALKGKGNAVKFTHGFSSAYEWGGIYIEHHQRLMDIRSPLKLSYLRQLEQLYPSHHFAIAGEQVAILAPELQLLQVNAHILKHMLSFGIGLRQLCDAAVLYKAYANKLDASKLREIYVKSGILKWIHLLHRVLVEHFGLESRYLPFPYPEAQPADWMMEEIWYAGNFGYNDERHRDGKISFVSVNPNGAKRLWGNFKRYLPYAPQEAIFFPIVHTYSKYFAKDEA